MRSFFDWRPLAPDEVTKFEMIQQWRFAALAGVLMFLIGLFSLPMLNELSFMIYLPLVLSALVFGLPHGAVDHLVLIGLNKQQLNWRTLSFASGLYLLGMGVYFVVWYHLPLLALLFFILMTIYHWGKSDLVFAELVMSKRAGLNNRISSCIHLLNRGTLPILTPFVFHSNETYQFLSSCMALFGEKRVEFSSTFTCIIGLIWLILLVTDSLCIVFVGFSKKHYPTLYLLAENVLLVLFFSFVPPLFAMGLYFSLWHGLRHCLRLSYYKEPRMQDDFTSKGLSSKLIRFFWRALPFTIAALLIGFCLLYASQLEVYEANELTAFYLVLIACLTFPHLCVVEWMDKIQMRILNNSR